MSEKEEIAGECVDGDEWGDLITTPNHLIPDEFLVLKAEEMDDRQLDDEKSRKSTCNGSRIRVSVSSSPATAWSQLLTLPSEFSLDDSPIMLSNSQGSPTTGIFPFPPLNHEILGMNSAVDDSSCDSNSLTCLPHEGSLWSSVSDLQTQPPVLSEFPVPLRKGSVTKGSAKDLHSSEEFKALKSTINNANDTAVQPAHNDNQTSATRQFKETNLSTMKNSEDGYNWRKYGQKQVKGSEYPRSYYKCTHPNCQVKKKVERSHDGHITEIIYKGAHNHQGQCNITGSTEANGSYLKIGESEVWGNIQQGGTNNIAICKTQDGMELSPIASVVIDNSDLVSPNQRKSMGIYGNPELSSANANYDVNDEDGTHIDTLSPGDEADEDKSDLKRRKKGNFLLETSLVTRAMREPRVVVQIESEIDILDDGYRWRKYGQKVVKGNPNPRSYYKCTTTGCPVRKHVERASDDLKSVLTTYEGKHNHELPAARNSTHSHATMDHGSTTNIPNQPLSKINNVPKSESQVQDLPLRYDRKLNNDYMPSSNFIGNFDTEPTKYVPFQNPLSFNSILPDFPMSLPMTIPSANMVHNGFGFNSNGKRSHDAHSFIGGQGRDNNGRYLKPKLEQDDGFYDTFMRALDHVNDASSRYCRAIPNFQT